MASNIDPTKPVEGNPTTLSVRDNFQASHDEISDLQTQVDINTGDIVGKIGSVEEDTTPVLGGDIDYNGFSAITFKSAGFTDLATALGMTLTDVGLGIDTAIPFSALVVSAPVSPILSVQDRSNANIDSITAQFQFVTSNETQAALFQVGFGDFTFLNRGSGDIGWGNGASAQMTLTNTGNVGVGVNNPNSKLGVQSESAALTIGSIVTDGTLSSGMFNMNFPNVADTEHEGITFGVNNVAGRCLINFERGSVSTRGSLHFYTSDLKRMTLRYDGNVGIGVPDPLKALQVEGSIEAGDGTTGVDLAGVLGSGLVRAVLTGTATQVPLTLQGSTVSMTGAVGSLIITNLGEIRISDLSGTGTRNVQVLPDGTLIAV